MGSKDEPRRASERSAPITSRERQRTVAAENDYDARVMAAPRAYFITFTSFGTWLHGDRRGSVDKHHAAPGAEFTQADDARWIAARRRMTGKPVQLCAVARRIVATTIRDHCKFRRWELWAVSVRSNHVHVVVTCPIDVSPNTAMSQFKSWATRRLRAAKLFDGARTVWTRHGSTRWINSQASFKEAVRYVLEEQDNFERWGKPLAGARGS